MRHLLVVVLALAACGGDDWLVDVTDSTSGVDDVTTFPVDADPEDEPDAALDAGPPPVLRALTVTWTFRTVLGEPKACPEDATATFRAHVLDDLGVPAPEATATARFACTDAHVAAVLLPAGRYLAYVLFGEDPQPRHGMTLAEVVDLREGNGRYEGAVVVDGGYIALTWELERASDGAKLACAEVAGGVHHISARIASTTGTSAVEHELPCDARDALTPPIAAGEYTVTVAAIAADGKRLGTAKPLTATVGEQNRITQVGVLEIPIEAL